MKLIYIITGIAAFILFTLAFQRLILLIITGISRIQGKQSNLTSIEWKYILGFSIIFGLGTVMLMTSQLLPGFCMSDKWCPDECNDDYGPYSVSVAFCDKEINRCRCSYSLSEEITEKDMADYLKGNISEEKKQLIESAVEAAGVDISVEIQK